MKILFVATVYRHLTAFHIPHIKYFQGLGYEVWAASSDGQYDKELLEKEQVKCVDISFSRSPKSIDNLKAIKQMKKLLVDEKFNFIDVHTPIAAFITRYVAKNLQNTKVVYTAHGFHFYKGAPLINWLLYYTAEKVAVPWTEHLITINHEDFNISKKLGYKKEQVSYIHGVGVELTKQSISKEIEERIKKDFAISDNQVVIAYIAELNDNKNHMFLLSNWERIKEQAPNAKLLIIGQGSLEANLKQYVHRQQLKDIIFTGYRRDVESILKIANIVTLLSKREGLPKSIMEGMINSLPCVVSNTRGLRDLIHSNKNGYIVDLEDNNSLISAFSNLVNNEGKRKGFGRQAKIDIEAYMLENTMKEYSDIYKKLMNDEVEK